VSAARIQRRPTPKELTMVRPIARRVLALVLFAAAAAPVRASEV
jgi:hypothetical protein